MTLNDLPQGSECKIVRIMLDDSSVRRLKNLGLLKGNKAKVVRFSPKKDLVEVFTNGFFLAIRRQTAEKIIVTVMPKGE